MMITEEEKERFAESGINPFGDNPPLGDLPPGADGVEPRDTPISPDAPKMERGEDRYMSRVEAIYILGKLATSRRINVDGVIALQMGARSLMKRHFDRQRNYARRRAEGQAAIGQDTQDTRDTHDAAPCPGGPGCPGKEALP